MIDVGNKIKRVMIQRAHKLQFDKVYELIKGKPFILAGGALSGDAVHDFDVYPDQESPYTFAEILHNLGIQTVKEASLIAHTKNALTVMLREGQVVQFCSYQKAGLKELVDSFDFSHVQAGVRFSGANEPPRIDGVYYTDAFVAANVTRQTEYTGSEYPTSSMVRTLKYYKRGKITKGVAGRMLLMMMADVLKRGFDDYADFKDQMDAIDLGLPDCDEARELYKAVCDAKLVREESDK